MKQLVNGFNVRIEYEMHVKGIVGYSMVSNFNPNFRVGHAEKKEYFKCELIFRLIITAVYCYTNLFKFSSPDTLFSVWSMFLWLVISWCIHKVISVALWLWNANKAHVHANCRQCFVFGRYEKCIAFQVLLYYTALSSVVLNMND